MSDTFRKEYKPLTEEQKAMMLRVKEQAEVLEQMFNEANTPDVGRLISLAKTSLEESIMWAVKAITA